MTANPATGRTEREFDEVSDAAVPEVLNRSAGAFPGWRATPVAERAAILSRVADAHEARTDELAGLISVEVGKPVAQAAGEVGLAAAIYRWYAEHGPALLEPELLDPQGADESLVETEPIGSIIGVRPLNYPGCQVARFAGPNLMVGDTIILEHAPICAASAQVMAEIAHTARVLEDVYVDVFATNDQIATMIADPRVRGISLTGSERAGAAVAEAAGKNLKKAVLELGGSDPLIVLDDVDLDDVDLAATATGAAKARLSNTGQACNSPKRMIVANDQLEGFVSSVVQIFESAQVGDPSDPSTEVGPLSSIAARDKVVAQVKRAGRAGRDVDSADEAVRLANDVSFGLSGSVWSKNIARVQEIADQLEVAWPT